MFLNTSSKTQNMVWDLWLTEYNPLWWQHVFEGCPFNHASTGRGTSSSSTDTGKDLCSSLLFEKSS